MSDDDHIESNRLRRVDRTKVIRLFLRTFSIFPFLPAPELYDLFSDLTKSRSALGEKVERSVASLNEASKLVSDLQMEIEGKVGKVRELQDQYSKYEQLAQVEEEKVRIILDEISSRLKQGRPAERWIALGINIVAGLVVFALGVFLGPYIKQHLGI